jgi:hypothetical protein
LTTPGWYISWRATFPFESVEYGIGGVALFRPNDVSQAQVGFAVASDGESFVGTGPGDWRPEWVAIGYDMACGDPIFASQETPHPVFTAMHGEGAWEPKRVSPSLDVFRECLTVFQRFATGRNTQLDLDANPPTPEEQAQFLQNIRTLTQGDPEALGFWAVQVEVDLDTFEL